MLAWDILVMLLTILDAALLPAPGKISVERRFDNSPVLGEPTAVTIEVTQGSNQILEIRVTDALHPALDPMPATQRVLAYPRDAAQLTIECAPNTRGDVTLGKVHLQLSRSARARRALGCRRSRTEYSPLSTHGALARRYGNVSVTNSPDRPAETTFASAGVGTRIRKPAGVSTRRRTAQHRVAGHGAAGRVDHPMPRRRYANASSPTEGRVGSGPAPSVGTPLDACLE